MLWCGRGHPDSGKKTLRDAEAKQNLSCWFHSIPGIAPRVALRIVGCHSENWISQPEKPYLKSESYSKTTLCNSPQEFREWFFRSESVLPEIGVIPRLLN